MMPTSQHPLVSVVIPTYNRADSLLRAINSVLNQTYQNLEVIVVDDCSAENIARVVGDVNDNRPIYLRHDINQGGSAARNTGINKARGEYIAFLDSDDVWLPQKLELQLRAIAERADGGDRVVSYTKFQKSDRVFYQPAVLPKRGKKNNETMADYLWLGGGETLTSTLLVSRSLTLTYPFRTELRKHQDLDFVLGLEALKAEFIFVPQVLTIWHNEPRSDRVSRLRNYKISLDWIASYQDRISERAYKGFILKEVAPKMLGEPDTKSTAIKLLLEGVRENIIPFYYFLFLTLKQAISRKSQQSIKAWLQRLKILDR